MANKKSDILSAKEITAAEELVDRILAEQLGKHVANFFDPSRYPDVPPSKDQLMPNGKKLGDCNKRDLLILSYAYNQAAERMDSDTFKTSVASKFSNK